MKNIIVFSQEYPPYSWGGATPFTVNLVNGLNTLGVHVQLLTICNEESYELQTNGVAIYRIPAAGIYQDESMDSDRGFRRHFQFLKKAKTIAARMQAPDFVILADSLCFPEAKGCALHFGVPLVTMVNQIFSDINGLWNDQLTSMTQLEKRYFQESDRLVVGSQYMQLRMATMGYGQKTTHINYGWGFQKWAQQRLALPPTDFIFVGRMVPEKGVLALIEAFRTVCKVRPHCQLKLIGDGPMKTTAELVVKNYGLAQNVAFCGALPWTQISKVFQSARYTLVPSLNEPFGYVALEAIMYGALPIMSDTGGLREIATTVAYACQVECKPTAPFIYYPDVGKLSDKMLEFLELSDPIRKELQQSARLRASATYNFLTTTAQWLTLLENL
ncbi:MAG: hypothetical protein C5B47_02440 [Verrucomicrobia bacterium]|nr:MAG: hypothetical protein C5B47_02440 [Verrucomicrobiota bacterium]